MSVSNILSRDSKILLQFLPNGEDYEQAFATFYTSYGMGGSVTLAAGTAVNFLNPEVNPPSTKIYNLTDVHTNLSPAGSNGVIVLSLTGVYAVSYYASIIPELTTSNPTDYILALAAGTTNVTLAELDYTRSYVTLPAYSPSASPDFAVSGTFLIEANTPNYAVCFINSTSYSTPCQLRYCTITVKKVV